MDALPAGPDSPRPHRPVGADDVSASTLISACAWGRSAGEYHGSLTRYYGPAVVKDDCECPTCEPLDPWDPQRHLDILVTLDGHTVKLAHVRPDHVTMGTRGPLPLPVSVSWAGWAQAAPTMHCRNCDREAWALHRYGESPRCSGCGSAQVIASP